MANLFRVVGNRSAWKSASDAASLSATRFFSDIKLEGASLSVWRAEAETSVEKAVAAIAASRDFVSNVDLVFVDEEAVGAMGVAIHAADGQTPYTAANSLHRDLNLSTLGQVVSVTQTFVQNETSRYNASQVRSLLMAAVRSGEIRAADLRERLRAKLDV